MKLTIEVDEGKPVLVDSISFEPSGSIDLQKFDSLTNPVISDLKLHKGDRFTDKDLMADISIIENDFKNKGYAYVDAGYSLNVQAEQKLTDIQYLIDPGQLSYIGATNIVGNKHVKEEFIRKQLKYEEGNLYNRSLLEETRRNLYFLQMFRVVSVLPQMGNDSSRNPYSR